MVHSGVEQSPSGLPVTPHLISESLVVHPNLQASKERVVPTMAVTLLVDELCPPNVYVEVLTLRP